MNKYIALSVHPGKKVAHLTQAQKAAIKSIVKENSGKKAARPVLALGYTYDDGATYYTNGCRMVRIYGSKVDDIETVDTTANNIAMDLKTMWQMTIDDTEAKQISLPDLDELRASDEQTVNIGEATFNRKWVIDFIKLHKTTNARLLKRYSKFDGKILHYILQGASEDKTVESILLSLRPTA